MTGADWSPLGFPSHPIPGDPSQVATLSRYYADVAAAINATAANLRQVALDTQVRSDAVEAFAELALSVASAVNQIDGRYSVVSTALGAYGSELDRVRSLAWDELVGAEARSSERRFARHAIVALEDQLQDATTPPANLPHLVEQLHVRQRDVVDASAAIDAAASRVAELVAQRAVAAQAAAALIEGECRGSSLNDGAWDKCAAFATDLWNGVLDALETLVAAIDFILEKLEILSFILAVMTLILILSGVGIAVLAMIAFIVAALSLALTTVKLQAQVVLAVHGRTTWAEVGRTAVDVAFAVVGVVAAGSGVGAAATLATASATVASDTAEVGAKQLAQQVIDDITEEALVDFFVEGRAEDWSHDVIDYAFDVASGDDPPSSTSVMYDYVFTDGEQLSLHRSLAMLDTGMGLAGEGVRDLYEGVGQLIKVGV